MPRLLIAGFGYSAAAVVDGLGPDWRITATARGGDKAARLERRGIAPVGFDGTAPSRGLAEALVETTHLLLSAPPDASGDPVLRHHAADIATAPRLTWIGYLSTVGVYGDHGGAWVDETTQPAPGQPRSIWRLAAEEAWRDLARRRGTALQLVRLGGIYGPGRNQLVALEAGTQRRIVKPGQVFNRIHVEDIGGLVRAGIARPEAGPVLNGVDDLPAPPQDVVVEAARLMGVAPPPEIALEAAGLSPMGLSFYGENKRVSNAGTKAALGYDLRYPTYREGLAALAAARDWQRPPPADA